MPDYHFGCHLSSLGRQIVDAQNQRKSRKNQQIYKYMWYDNNDQTFFVVIPCLFIIIGSDTPWDYRSQPQVNGKSRQNRKYSNRITDRVCSYCHCSECWNQTQDQYPSQLEKAVFNPIWNAYLKNFPKYPEVEFMFQGSLSSLCNVSFIQLITKSANLMF